MQSLVRITSVCRFVLFFGLILESGCFLFPSRDFGGEDPDYLDGISWPKEIDAPIGKIVIYQPQLDTFSGISFTGRLAVSVTKSEAADPVFGAVWIKGLLIIDHEVWTAFPIEVQVTDVRFPQLNDADSALLRAGISSELPKWRMTMTLDHCRTELALVEREQVPAREFKSDSPEIVFRQHPSVLVSIDGNPIWHDPAGTPYRRIANSAFSIFQDKSTQRCYLHISPFWWTAPSAQGPWLILDPAPEAGKAASMSEPKPDLPPPDENPEPQDPPEVVVATRPTELVWTEGPPDLVPIPGTDLLYVRNTHSDLFKEVGSQTYFILLSGRWFKSPGGEGVWTYVPADQLPADFGRIPPGSPKERVLACVAGTVQANEALQNARIPQTAALRRGISQDLHVEYDGPPRFEKMPGSPVQYAVNTPYSVFLFKGRHYCCHSGVWTESHGPSGPWEICAAVPSEIYLIPPSCPHYHCTYCYVYSATPDMVYVGYDPGYLGCYSWGPTVIFGTGWHYRGWRGAVWYPWPLTWGLSVFFDFLTGCWEFELGIWGPCAWAGLDYGPGRWGHTGIGGWWGGTHYRVRSSDIHHNLNFQQQIRNNTLHNLYSRQPQILAPIHTQLPARVAQPGGSKRLPNNVFADKAGNAYRKLPTGGWERHTTGGWRPTMPTAPTTHQGIPQLDHSQRDLEQRERSRTLSQERTRQVPLHSPSSAYSSPSSASPTPSRPPPPSSPPPKK